MTDSVTDNNDRSCLIYPGSRHWFNCISRLYAGFLPGSTMAIWIGCSGFDKTFNVAERIAGGRIGCPVCDTLLKKDMEIVSPRETWYGKSSYEHLPIMLDIKEEDL